MLSLGFSELVVLPVVGLLIFGSRRLPKLARSPRRARHEFPSGTCPQAGHTSEPVGLTLRQIQFRGLHGAAPQRSSEARDGSRGSDTCRFAAQDAADVLHEEDEVERSLGVELETVEGPKVRLARASDAAEV